MKQLTFAEYLSIDAINISRLKHMKKSPAHFIAEQNKIWVDTPSTILGSAVHCKLLEPELFDEDYVLVPDFGDQRKKENKEARTFFMIEHIGKIGLDTEQMYIVNSIQNILMNDPIIKRLFKLVGNNLELVFNWTDEETGEQCKARLDMFIKPCKLFPNGLVIDFKTTQDCSLHSFRSSIGKYGYGNQLGWYAIAFFQEFKVIPDTMLITVETSAPFDYEIYLFEEDSLQNSINENKVLLKKYSECKAKNDWPLPTKKINTIALNNWDKFLGDNENE